MNRNKEDNEKKRKKYICKERHKAATEIVPKKIAKWRMRDRVFIPLLAS
jgi:hypothetical protein